MQFLALYFGRLGKSFQIIAKNHGLSAALFNGGLLMNGVVGAVCVITPSLMSIIELTSSCAGDWHHNGAVSSVGSSLQDPHEFVSKQSSTSALSYQIADSRRRTGSCLELDEGS